MRLRSQASLDAGVHLFLFDEFTPRNLIDLALYLFLEPLVARKQAGDGLLVQLGFLSLRQGDFHRLHDTGRARARQAACGSLTYQLKVSQSGAMSDIQILTIALAIIVPLSLLIYSNSRVTDVKEVLRAEMHSQVAELRLVIERNHSEMMLKLAEIVGR